VIRAVFGGSFDPVHRGHERAVRTVLAQGLADVVHVVPAWRSPHKSSFSAPPADRLAMVRLVFEGTADVRIETLEIRAAASAFTVDTLEELCNRYRHDTWRIVMGADQLAAFDQWHRPERILELAEPILLARQAGDLAELCALAGLDPDRCRLLPGFDERVSATSIRASLAGGREAGDLLDSRVAAYIRAHGLYGA